MSRSTRVGVAVFLAGLALSWLSSAAQAAEEKAKADATGTWKSSFEGPNGNTIESTYKFKQDGNKLTGTLSVQFGDRKFESKIENGKVEDGKISFQVTRERNDQKFTTKYEGTLKGDTIKGKAMMPGRDGGEGRSRDWEAKRQ